MKRLPLIVMTVVAICFVASWLLQGANAGAESSSPYLQGFLVTTAAFLTLCIFSFLYQDNPFYKFAEHLFVGISAAYWMCLGFWSTIVGNLIPRLSEGLSNWFKVPYQPGDWNIVYWVPVILGLFLLMRLTANYGWLARWSLAFIVGTTAGLNFVRYLRSDFIEQISSSMLPLLVDWQGMGHFVSNFSLSADGQFILILSNWVIFIGVICGLIYFFFSKEHTGLFGQASRAGIWILMITFGASFGYTVMGRLTLLVGRLTFLFRDWLGIIN